MTDTLPDHRRRSTRCPDLVDVNGLLVRCCADTGHSGGHKHSGGDYVDAEHAARAAGWRQRPTVKLSDLCESEGYVFVVDPEPWKREGIQGDPPCPESFTALVCRPSGVSASLIACVDDSLDHAFSVAHEIAGDREGHAHTERMLSRQAQILAGWVRRVGDQNNQRTGGSA